MRKIASNYIYLPHYPLIKNGYVVWDGAQIVDVVDTGGCMKEIQGLEFYGGLIVAGYVMGAQFEGNGYILPVVRAAYAGNNSPVKRLAIIEGADLVNFKWQPAAKIRFLL